ncbi:cytochrome P450 3A5 [Trichonephila inaurata madagascariensis]|uniref:Cytochrome P450 3A5 n=1 Tax=Trichonephila inaurata madagascariensis TaxID=2747483 RepID=A0A8X6X6I6_9ARAC|nr:cytochrome P450 3A5 [Trichonephila inaurata madagascariensis]
MLYDCTFLKGNRLNNLKLEPISVLLKENIGKYGKHFGSFEWSTPVYVITDPDLLRDVMVKDFHKFHYRTSVEVDDPITKHAVSILKGEDWKRVRTVITPAFTSKRMRQMGTIINDCSKSVVEICEKFFKEGKLVECRGSFEWSNACLRNYRSGSLLRCYGERFSQVSLQNEYLKNTGGLRPVPAEHLVTRFERFGSSRITPSIANVCYLCLLEMLVLPFLLPGQTDFRRHRAGSVNSVISICLDFAFLKIATLFP